MGYGREDAIKFARGSSGEHVERWSVTLCTFGVVRGFIGGTSETETTLYTSPTISTIAQHNTGRLLFVRPNLVSVLIIFINVVLHFRKLTEACFACNTKGVRCWEAVSCPHRSLASGNCISSRKTIGRHRLRYKYTSSSCESAIKLIVFYLGISTI
jgi:hypothetical protein